MRVPFAIVLLLLGVHARAQQFDPKELQRQAMEAPLNAYRFIGNALICKSDKADINPNTCNRIGEVTVGDNWNVVVEKLGKPSRMIPRRGGALAFVYFREAPDGSQSYWVVEKPEIHNKVTAIQLTGYYKIPDVSFSSIQLTDSEEKVRQILGPRYVVRKGPEIKGEMWDYAPFKITIEFVDGKVYSMRVSNDS